MAHRWNRIETWLLVIVLGLAGLALVIGGFYAYMTGTATPLHPDPGQIRAVSGPASPAAWSDAVARARQIMCAGLGGQNLPGLSVAVGIDDDIVWAEGFGWADLDRQVPVSPETRFRIGTASKVLTSAAVGLLLEQKRLSLDEKIQRYVPEFPEKQWPVTLRHLMGHVAGVRNDGGDEGPLYSQRCERPVEAFRFFADRPLIFEPGTRYRFSNYGWIVVSAAIEAAAERPLLSFMRRQIFDPLGMTRTVPDSTTDPAPDSATPYFPRFAAEPRYGLHLMRDIDLSCYSGSAVLVSTPSDLVRFGMAIQRGRLLQPATVDTLQTPLRLPSGEDTGYGLGWEVKTVTLAGQPTRVVGHDGDTLGGRVVSLLIAPEHGIVVAVASNISYADTFTLARDVADAFATARPRSAS